METVKRKWGQKEEEDGVFDLDDGKIGDLIKRVKDCGWRGILRKESNKWYFKELERFVSADRAQATVIPDSSKVFSAFDATPLKKVKVVVIGQFPGSKGMCFMDDYQTESSSLIVEELYNDIPHTKPSHTISPSTYMDSWAKQGVLFLSSSLTGRSHDPAAHDRCGWQLFTDSILAAINLQRRPVVFMLWGGFASKKAKLINCSRHKKIHSAFPSKLTRKKWIGSKPFSQCNALLKSQGRREINWHAVG
eukprot:TRINITY_DN9058_c0_g1_i1.p1 TRINITY_DN9058_c0_g1~~TRINITY_DN9058_c0_g1_i1.p1  ORF type:complete len:268 (+),score=18.73 TRINITY_DN9058_c0_g1_i1:59-805(+)